MSWIIYGFGDGWSILREGNKRIGLTITLKISAGLLCMGLDVAYC